MKYTGKGLLIILFVTILGGCSVMNAAQEAESKELADGTKIKFRTNKEQLEIYKNDSWSPFFVKGVNMGATLPGYFPGEHAIKKEDYLRWFEMIKEMGANTIRIYTIHDPAFYQALVEFNQKHNEDPLYFMQGVWSPVNLLKEKKDAWAPEVTKQFKEEMSNAIGAVSGDITLPENPGKASGEFTADASSYLVSWHIGTEWDPEIVENTNKQHNEDSLFQGDYFETTKEASAFESWLAELMDDLAEKEEAKGWQHPITFTNWITTDPLEHPDEPFVMEDLVSVDATHIQRTNETGGYFASYHAYPYYPDFLRYTDKYDNVKNDEGKVDTYKGYLQELKEYHKDMPIMITEFGVPASRGNAHFGPLDRDQGGHMETEQGQHNVDMLQHIYQEDYAGAVVFTWQDEWFKKTWNTMGLEDPHRRPFWYNNLSVEMSYGLLGMYPDKHDELTIDGELADWDKLEEGESQTLSTALTDFNVTHDEGYVYLAGHLPEDVDAKEDTIYFGVNTLAGGMKKPESLQGKTLDDGLETLVQLGGGNESEVLIAPSYDFHQRMYDNATDDDQNSSMHSWKLAVSRKVNSSKVNKTFPFEEVSVGELKKASTSKDSQADWAVHGDVIEVRIPWSLLGIADPSSKQAVSYSAKEKGDTEMLREKIEGIRFIPWVVNQDSQTVEGIKKESISVTDYPLYNWEEWQKVEYDEQLKQSYYMIQDAFTNLE
ncbi:hypothetical protein MUN88_03075 [Gracilibacillus caseinilyticus]|uniref:Family 2 glycosyl transferase n=1 Tax=Gracilibacillus caseinilyticus TaxID=2932256 RepID=A0ABY4EXY8_9BACI|nr:hypothetical protein [Gracilibacillus caseinilyticus]UOQ49123.1 hypothetical protein MUN88_03075 [Gracilibacillus caseinilyticus]